MEERLRDLKKEYENLPISFTNEDKIAILTKIKEENIKPVKRGYPLLPKPMIAAFSIAILFAVAVLVNNEFQIIPFQKQNSDVQPENDVFLFSIEDLQVGEKVGDFTVASLELLENEQTITLTGEQIFYGDVVDKGEVIQFIPYGEQPRAKIPLPTNYSNLGDVSFQLLDPGKMQTLFEFTRDSKVVENQALIITEMVYNVSDRELTVNVQLGGVTSESEENSYPTKPIQANIELSEEMQQLYSAYATNYDDKLLIGLEPFQVFQLYQHAEQINDLETIYALYIKGEEYATPDKETFMNDTFYQPTEEMKENAQKFYEELLKVTTFNEVYASENEAYITYYLESDPIYEKFFRLIKDSKTGAWKVSWVPIQ
jgi:hypothetical protein